VKYEKEDIANLCKLSPLKNKVIMVFHSITGFSWL